MAGKLIYPRVVRPVPDPLALYFRVGRASQKDLSNLIAVGDAACFGVVFDPTLIKPHQELRVALGDLEQKMPVRPVAVLPQTRAARDARPYGNGRAP